MLPFTREELQLAVDEGRVYARRHPNLPYTIYNYSDEVAFGGWWNNVTLNCRGLILDDDFNIVARPWKKFFNMGQRDNEIDFHAPVEVTDKLDGSLGILYSTRAGGHAIATRGSFDSKQAQDATKIWMESYFYLDSALALLSEYTFLFEILLPWNRIVVDYYYDGSEYLSKGRGPLPQRSSRNDRREHLHSSQQGMEDLSSLSERSAEAQSTEESRKTSREFSSLATREQGALSGIGNENLQEDSTKNLGGEGEHPVHRLRSDVSSGMHGLRPSARNEQEVQHRSGQKSSGTGRGNGEMRVGLRELSQDSNLDYTPGNLVLLGAVHKEHNYYLGPTEAAGMLMWPGPVAEVFEFKDFGDALSNWPERPGKEGVVVRSGNKMVKLKQPDYLELHKLVTNATPLNVWRQLKEGFSGFQIVSNFPDEFHDYIWDMVEPLQKAYDTRLSEIMMRFAQTVNPARDRKYNAMKWANEPDKRYYFLLLDEKSIRTLLWTELRPRETKDGS